MRLRDLSLGFGVVLASALTTRAQLRDAGGHLRTQPLCPRTCSENPAQADWNSFYSVEQLKQCDQPILFTLNTFIPVDDPTRQVKIRTCSSGEAEASSRIQAAPSPPHTDFGRVARRDALDDAESAPPVCLDATNTNTTARWLTWGSEKTASTEDVARSLRDAQSFLEDQLNCEENVVYGYFRDAIVGVYVGRKIQNSGVATGFLQDALDRIASNQSSSALSKRTVSQVCGGDLNSDNHLGVVVDPRGDLAWVQKATRSWAEARCVNESSSEAFESSVQFGSTIPIVRQSPLSKRRAAFRPSSCERIQASHGDTTKSLASACGITTKELTKLNSLPDSWEPQAHQWVCCSPGLQKRAAPGPRPDGTCVSYIVQNMDTCFSISRSYDTTEADLYTFNKQMWGWGGCNNLFPGMRICVGPGTPRLPAPNPDAECGPSKPGTGSPAAGQEVKDLSPCPIKACCNIWGKCGVDKDFCVPTQSETGNPGTAAPHTDGCVQNCGMDIVNNGSPPPSFMKVGYYEAWNRERPCLHMTPQEIPSTYTHIHYSFADITPGFGVGLGRFADVFEQFKALKGPKRIVAFGGWAFSTEPETYQFFRDAVKPENRNTFADACVNFVNTHGLDGVDFDWEYPGEPDIPGIPAGGPEEGQNYLEFVKVVKSKMPAGKTVSFAAPASYWYLKQFLVAEMAEVVDYVIYMTYDLHGQWDYDNDWTQPGCKAGNCLRSHVNFTETLSAFAMITKAGVPSSKVIAGVSSYGRSFQMTSPSCTGPMCTYTGPESGAEHGKCTGTGGYISNGEIDQIIADGRVTSQWTDDTRTDYIVFGDTWVAYMDESNKQARTRRYQSMNFGGTTDWAIDLQGDVGGDDRGVVYLAPEIYSGTPAQCTPPCLFVLPPSGLPSATTVTIPAYTTSIQIEPGTTSTITVNAPPLTVNSMQYSNVNVSMSQPAGFFQPSLSLDLPPFVTTVTAPGGLIQTRTLLLPPWPAITSGPPSEWNITGGPWVTGQPSNPPEQTVLPPITNPPPVTWPTPVKPPYTPGPVVTQPWPDEWEIIPVPEDVSEEGEEDEDGKSKSTCKLWFFFVCISWSDFGIKIGGWKWNLPPGIWGPGPPGFGHIKWPPGFTLKGELPPWPQITVLPNGKIQPPPPKPADCTPAEASLCYTTSSFGTTVSGGATRTTATQVKSTCATITGCNLRDVEATKTVDACTLNSLAVRATDHPQAAALQKRAAPFSWVCDKEVMDGIIWPQDNDDEGQSAILEILKERDDAFKNDGKTAPGYIRFRADGLEFTAFYWVFAMGKQTQQWLSSDQVPSVQLAYWPERAGRTIPNPPESQGSTSKRDGMMSSGGDMKLSRFGTEISQVSVEEISNDNTTQGNALEDDIPLSRRAYSPKADEYWHLSHLSFPKTREFDRENGDHKPAQNEYLYSSDDSWGSGQTIYIMDSLPDEDILDPPLSNRGRFRRLYSPYPEYGKRMTTTAMDRVHGTLVMSFAAGKTVGVARKANVVVVDVDTTTGSDQGPNYFPRERLWEALINIANDQQGRKNEAVVNMSFMIGKVGNPVFNKVLTKLMNRMEWEYGIVFVAAAGNDGGVISSYPALANGGLAGMMVVGATDSLGFPWEGNSRSPANDPELIWATAPGAKLPITPAMRRGLEVYKLGQMEIEGTSYATALVSGLVAYLRGNPGYDGGRDPFGIKWGIKLWERPLNFDNGVGGRSSRLVWNGYLLPADEPPPDNCALGQSNDLKARQAACPLPGGGGSPQGPPVSFRPGPPSPLCTANCGKLCSGFYCVPNPTGTPPDFFSNVVTTGQFPEITPPPGETGGPGEWCLSTSTFRQCNGGPRGQACITTTSCASWGRPDLPTLTTEPPFSPPGGSCLHSTTWTELGGPKFDATITKSSCDQWSTPAPPTPTPEPEPPAPPPKPRCFTAHLYIRTCVGPDSYVLKAWENGVELNCKGRRTIEGMSDKTVLEYDCDGGGYVAITNFGSDFQEYKAGDGWTIKPRRIDGHSDDTECGSFNGYQYEHVYENGECGNCPVAGLCDYRSFCSDFDGTCRS